MPYWEFTCKDCQCFLTLSIAAHETYDEIRCPLCDTSHLEIQAFETEEGGLQAIFIRISDLETRLSRLEKLAPTKEDEWN